MIERRRERKDAVDRHASMARLDPHDAAERGRPDDRTVRLRPDRRRHDAGGDARGRAHRRAPRCALEVVRVAGRAGVVIRELGGHRLAEDDGARGREVRHERRIAIGYSSDEDRTPTLGGHARHVDDVLHPDRDAVEQTDGSRRATARVRRVGKTERALAVQPRERMKGRLGLVVPAQRGLDESAARDEALRDRARRGGKIGQEHSARMVYRGTQPLGRSALGPAILRNPARRNCAAVPKNAVLSWTFAPGARGYPSTAGAPCFPAYSTAALSNATVTPVPRWSLRTKKQGTTHTGTSSTRGVARDASVRRMSVRGPS